MFVKNYSSELSVADVKTLRYAFGATVAMAIAMGINWPYSYITLPLTINLLNTPRGRLSFKQALGFVFVIVAACFLAVVIGGLLVPYPFVFIPFLGLLLFRIYYERGSKLSPFMILWLLIALLVIPLIMLYRQNLSDVVVGTLIASGTMAIISSWIAYAVFPEREEEKLAASAPLSPSSEQERYHLALESTLVVFPLLIIFYFP